VFGVMLRRSVPAVGLFAAYLVAHHLWSLPVWLEALLLIGIFVFAGSAFYYAWQSERARAKAEAALAEGLRRFHLLADNVRDVIWTTDLSLKLTYISPSVQQLLGHSPQEALRLPPEANLTPETFEKVAVLLQEEFAADAQHPDPDRHATVEMEQIRADGTHVFTEARVQFLRDGQGRPSGVIGVSRDISERKRAEQERRRLETQLRQAQKMEAIGSLAGGIAHDFNNILAAIIGFTQVAMDGANEQARADLAEVLRAGERARDLVQQILTFSRRIEQARRPLQLRPLIGEALKLLRASLPPSIRIEPDLANEDLKVLADPSQIHQVLMNLCTNAFHAMQDSGGTLRIGLQPVKEPEPIWRRHPGLEGTRLCLLEVSDTGEGMDAGTLARVFDPFFTTKDVDRGTGLGLSVVHGIVGGHGGRIEAESEVGKGATFRIFLPLAEQPETDEAGAGEYGLEEDPQRRELVRGTERILLVDDEQALVEVGRRQLSRLGYRVTGLLDPNEALRLVQEDPAQFDLLITDQFMPNMTGAQLAAQIHKLRADLPILVATGGSGEELNRDPAAGHDIRQVLLKPLHPLDLATAIRKVMDG
jgi:PAS domain S-box-containing protein